MILDTLRREHPRLVATDGDIDRLRRTIAARRDARAVRDRLHESALAMLDASPVEHRLIGPRLLTESRKCLERVYTLGLMYRLEGDRRFADRAIKEMLTAAGFSDWNPSHFLDTAEMTHALAIGYDWLHDALAARSRAAIRQAIVDKGMKPALEKYAARERWVMYQFNWSQVCNGGIGIGALAIADEAPELAETVVARAITSIRRPMETYAPDGGWDEGPTYWHYATRYNVYLIAALESALGTDFGLSALPAFSDTGDFRMHSIGPLGWFFNFADAPPQGQTERTTHEPSQREARPVEGAHEMFWLARKFKKPVYSWHQNQFLGTPHALDLIWFQASGRGPASTGFPLDAHYRKTDVVFARSAWEDPLASFLGFKGGDNRVAHSHLDLGSFVFDALGHRWAVDLGRDDYNLPGYFGDKRWTYYRMRTESHNTLVIDGQNQDPTAKAPILHYRSGRDGVTGVINLTEAYPMTASVMRGFAFERRKSLRIQDEVVAAKPVDVVWGMLTPAGVKADGPRALTLSQGRARLKVRIIEPAEASFRTVDANPPPPQAQNPGVTKVVVGLPGPVTSTRIVVTLAPDGAARRSGPPVKPLSAW